MKLLIIGGTRFLGRHLVTAALGRGHEITLFNRGNHSPEDQRGIETITGDRNRDLWELQGRVWDAVVDTCGYLPRAVEAAAKVLSDSVGIYVFISSQSAYQDLSQPGTGEDAPLKTLTPEQLEEANRLEASGQTAALVSGPMYGGLKTLCERAAEEVMPNRVLTIRPGLLVGPYDYTDRFTYWAVRVAEGGEVLAPGKPDKAIQFIDVRDLAEWTIRMIERRAAGVYNCNGMPGKLTMSHLLEVCKQLSESDALFTWVSEEFLLKKNVAAWSEMPLWLPEDAAPHLSGFMFVSCNRALGEGLTWRPLSDTVKDTLDWHASYRPNEPLKAGLERDKEHRLLAEFHNWLSH